MGKSGTSHKSRARLDRPRRASYRVLAAGKIIRPKILGWLSLSNVLSRSPCYDGTASSRVPILVTCDSSRGYFLDPISLGGAMRYDTTGMSAVRKSAAKTIQRRDRAAEIVMISDGRLTCSRPSVRDSLASCLDQGSRVYGPRGVAEYRGWCDQTEIQELVKTVGE